MRTAQETAQLRSQLSDRFRTVLADAQQQRPQRQSLVPSPHGPDELGWIVYERDTLYAEVNRARDELSLPPVTMELFLRSERAAVGSADYPLKLSLYCTELVLSEQF